MPRRHRKELRHGLPLVTALIGLACSQARAADDLPDLSLEELVNVQVSTVDKTAQRASDAAAAVFVITQDDIRRSGATSIPEALRLVPGLQVAQIDGNKWAISARGFNGRFANRLLVLMDGRTLYTMTFGGVFWDVQDTLIEDIERIEVVRGPGGATWGSNAFNGVINIITKHAGQTGGGSVSGYVGSNQPYGVSARIGSSEGPAKWRAFAKAFEQDGNRDFQGGDAHDTWRQARIGGRADINFDGGDTLQLTAETYRGSSGMDLWNYYALPTLATIPARDEYEGAFVNFEWARPTGNSGRIAVRGSADYTNRNSLIFDERRNTYELELQHNLPAFDAQQIIWGVDVRRTSDSTHRTFIAVVPSSESLNILSGFLQDDFAFRNDTLHVIAAGRVEHSDYVGTQFMPNLRLRFSPSERTTLWSAVSRGVRSASRLERDVRVTDLPVLPAASAYNPTPAPLGVEIWGDPNFQPEKLTAFEVGLRHRFHDTFSLDLAGYYNKYSDIRGVRLLPPMCAPSLVAVTNDPLCVLTATKVIVPMQYTNMLSGTIRGAELTATWNPTRHW